MGGISGLITRHDSAKTDLDKFKIYSFGIAGDYIRVERVAINMTGQLRHAKIAFSHSLGENPWRTEVVCVAR